MRAAVYASIALCNVAVLAADARADDGSGPASAALFQLGIRDEKALQFQAALDHYRASIDAAPGQRSARAARGRVAWLEQRSEGGFAPLAALQRVRADPAARDDPGALRALAHQVDGFPPGPVRAEARIFLGESWLRDPATRGDGLAQLRRVVEDPNARATDPLNVRYAERDLVEALLADGRLDEAAAVVAATPLDAKAAADVEASMSVRRHARQRRGAGIAAAVLLLGVAAWSRRAGASRRQRLAVLGPVGHEKR